LFKSKPQTPYTYITTKYRIKSCPSGARGVLPA
jgi:hypothetical protein